MTRRSFIKRVAIGAAVPSYAFGVEPRWLELTFHKIGLPAYRIPKPIRVLQLSDLHVSPFVPLTLIERAVDMGLGTKPDVICVTGDFITNQDSFDAAEYRRILRKLPAQAPCYACLGNHDGGPWAAGHIGGYPDTAVVRALLADSGIRLLDNRSEIVHAGRQPIRMAGVGDLWNEDVDADRALGGVRRDGVPTVLLAHNPDTKELVANHSWDVMLCGHTHGGQVLVPLVGTRFVAVRDKEFIAGLKQWNGRHIYISRGVGNLAGVRLNCRPEVTVLDIAGPAPTLDAEYRV